MDENPLKYKPKPHNREEKTSPILNFITKMQKKKEKKTTKID